MATPSFFCTRFLFAGERTTRCKVFGKYALDNLRQVKFLAGWIAFVDDPATVKEQNCAAGHSQELRRKKSPFTEPLQQGEGHSLCSPVPDIDTDDLDHVPQVVIRPV